MRISSFRPAPAPVASSEEAGELDAEIEGALLEQSQNQMKADGNAALALISAAADAGVNRPLTEGPVGRRINLKI